jgi:hypothetical protein
MKKIILLFSAVLCFSVANTQDNLTALEALDIIYLKDGNALKGRILKYQTNHSLKFQLQSGKKMTFPVLQIDSIKQVSTPIITHTGEFLVKEKGWYNTTYASALIGTTPWSNETTIGMGINNTVGYQFNPKCALGLGTGLDYYYIAQREIIMPFYVEGRYYMELNPSMKPFLLLSGGYGIALNDKNLAVEGIQGGWMYHPAIGFLFGKDSFRKWQFDAGIRIQQATFQFDVPWADRNNIIHKMLYQRFTMRLGLFF